MTDTLRLRLLISSLVLVVLGMTGTFPSLGAESSKSTGFAAPKNTAVLVDGGYETFYRSMSRADYDTFVKTGRMPATTETFISPTRAFSDSYEGVLVKFQLSGGTTDALRAIGVRAHGSKSAGLLPDLPQVKRGWGRSRALFKPEGDQINIGLGKGRALDLFNDSIRGFEVQTVVRP